MNYNWLDNFKGVKNDFTPNPPDYGFWAFLDNEGMLVIGEERGREGGLLYRGPWKGEKTPYLSEIKKEQPKLYSKITYFYKQELVNVTQEEKKTTKTVHVAYSILKTVEVPADWDDEEINNYLEGIDPEDFITSDDFIDAEMVYEVEED